MKIINVFVFWFYVLRRGFVRANVGEANDERC